ncbi:MAG TPA: acyltransferase [Bryobacteraceae bacterium]|nr:acyltransferase [Bryobacteraceae bacterium]
MTGRWHTVDVLRGLCILSVVLLHIQIRIPFEKSWVGALLPRAARRVLFYNGFYAVKVFFVISGFLITANILRRWGSLPRLDLGAFYRMRFARIAPCLLALLAVLAVLHTAGVEGFVINPARAGLGEAMLAALTFHINVLEIRVGYLPASWDVLWSLSIEEVFYLAYPLLCRLAPRRWGLACVGLGLAVAGPFARTVWAGGNEMAADKGYFTGFDCIAMGCAAAWLASELQPGVGARRALRWVGLALLAQVAIYPIVTAPLWRYGLDVTVLGAGAALFLAGLETRQSTTPGWNPLAWLGRSSYEIYLTHGFVTVAGAQLFHAWGQGPDATPFWHVGMVAVSGVLGWLTARFYSEPLNQRLRAIGTA